MPIAAPEIPESTWSKLVGEAPAVVEACCDLLRDSAWAESRQEHGMEVTTATVPGSKFKALRATVTITHPLQSCLSAINDGIEITEESDEHVRRSILFQHQTLSPGDVEAGTLQKVVDYCEPARFAEMAEPRYDMTSLVQYVVTSPTPLLVLHREMVVVQTMRELEGSQRPGDKRAVIVAQRSWDDETAAKLGEPADKYFPEPAKGEKWTRAQILAQAFIFEEIDANTTKGTFVVHTDPCGSVPAVLYNAVLKDQAKSLVDVQKVLDRKLARTVE